MIQINEFTRELIANGGFPVKHLSYSSMKEYLGNPRAFLKKYIRYEFDDQTKAVFMVGKSVHKALEEYFDKYMETGEFPEMTFVHAVGIDHFRRELLESRAKAITKWIKANGWESEFPIFTKDLDSDEIMKFYETASLEARQYVAIDPAADTPEKEEEYITNFLKDFVEYSLVTLGANQTIEELIAESEEKIIVSINNFFEHDWIPDGSVHSTEKEEVVFFQDETGEDMPIPVKVIIDRLDIVEIDVDGTESGKVGYSVVTDYKTVDKFSITDADKADYEMQAGPNYFGALVASWVRPRYMRFVEILKKTPGYIHPEQPDKTWRKEDLIDEIKKSLPDHVLGGKELVADLKKILIEKGVFVKETWVNVFEIDFDERPDVILTFLAMYKGIVNMVALSEMAGTYLPNISAQWGWLEAWNDFKELEGTPRDRTPKIQKMEDPGETKVEETPAIVETPKEDPKDDLEGIDSL